MQTSVTRRRTLQTGVAVLGAGLSGCVGNSSSDPGSQTETPAKQITVGSKAFTENRILGHMLIERLRANTNIQVINEISFSRETVDVWEGLKKGPLDTYWEYSGTLWLQIPPDRKKKISSLEKMYDRAKKLTESNHDVTVLNRAPFSNSYGIITTRKWVEKTGIETISEFVTALENGTNISVAVSEGNYKREDAWLGMLDHYGLSEQRRIEWENSGQVKKLVAGAEYARLLNGDVNVILRFTTDAQIGKHSLQVLEDDRNFWPAYSPAPVLRNPVLESNLIVQEQFNPIGPAIGGPKKMRELNARVEINNQSEQQVAREFLSSADLI